MLRTRLTLNRRPSTVLSGAIILMLTAIHMAEIRMLDLSTISLLQARTMMCVPLSLGDCRGMPTSQVPLGVSIGMLGAWFTLDRRPDAVFGPAAVVVGGTERCVRDWVLTFTALFLRTFVAVEGSSLRKLGNHFDHDGRILVCRFADCVD